MASNLLETLKETREYILEREKDKHDEKQLKRSVYNLIYGISLGVLFNKLKMLESPRRTVTEVLTQVESLQEDFYNIDLEKYDLDDITRELIKPYGVYVAKKLKPFKDISPQDFLQIHEKFFIDSF